MNKVNFNFRALTAFAHDVVAAALAWILAFWIRFNLEVPPEYAVVMLQTVLLVVPLQSMVFWVFGLYHGIWRFASLHDLQRILGAVTVSCLAVPTLVLFLRLAESVPRAVFLLDPLLLVLIMGGSRAAFRAWSEHRLYGKTQFAGEPVLILGSEEAAAGLIREISRSHEWRVVGILHDDDKRHGRSVNGVRVLGRIGQYGRRIGEILCHLHMIRKVPQIAHFLHIRRPPAQHVRICRPLENNCKVLEILAVPIKRDLERASLSRAGCGILHICRVVE